MLHVVGYAVCVAVCCFVALLLLFIVCWWWSWWQNKQELGVVGGGCPVCAVAGACCLPPAHGKLTFSRRVFPNVSKIFAHATKILICV